MSNLLSIKAALQMASAQLKTEESVFEVQLLLQYALGVNRTWLIAHEHDALQPNIHEVFEALLNRRLAGEPMAHILASREFYGLDLLVTPDTLIPRPDTETLVDAALEKLPTGATPLPSSFSRDREGLSILDLGTGTGAIALAIAHNCPQVMLVAVDASAPALAVAKQNAAQLNIPNVTFVLSDWFDVLAGKRFDLIVSNPPYIEQNDAHLVQGDLRFEPISALASGVDGLDDIRHIVEHCLIYLKPQGWLMLEHGYNQADAVTNLMAQVGLVEIETRKDLGGNDRVTIGKNPLIVSTHWD
ncbi:MAG: peptide chain release factor N(5)-glutamine methyltransferase [Methylotenera sp.]|nr:peptide chain release factor N(5)-glutamine methyltransferase [Methylotenera sp.]MSQ00056.1 peptide chain release factor N(5)-glutamine methyltransferase [Methylotenera sp.]